MLRVSLVAWHASRIPTPRPSPTTPRCSATRSARCANCPSKPRPRPTPRMAARDEAEALSEFRRAMTADALEAGDTLAYRRDAIPPRTLQRLRRGDYSAEDELDLHWADAKQAEAMLRDFL